MSSETLIIVEIDQEFCKNTYGVVSDDVTRTEETQADWEEGTLTDVEADGDDLRLVDEHALEFDGEDDYVEVSEPSECIPGSSSFTIEFWYLSNNKDFWEMPFEWPGGDRVYVGYDSREASGWNFVVNTDSKRVDTDDDKGLFPETYNTWFFVQAVQDRSNNKTILRVYNSDEDTWDEATVDAPSGETNPSGDLYIPSHIDDYPAKGLLNEMRFWHKIRTQNDAESNMNSRLSGDETGLVGYWPMNEGSGSTVYDESGNNNDGEIEGAEWTQVAGRYEWEGTRTSPQLDISAVGTVEDSAISWTETLNGETITIETRVSLDGGTNWTAWATCTNGGSIPDLSEGDDVSDGLIECRQQLSTSDATVTPELHSLTVEVLTSLLKSVCTATLGGENVHKCHNTRFTCQDPDNYSPEDLTLRFCRPQEGLEQYGYMIPIVESVSTTPTRINTGGVDRDSKELGRRAVADIVMHDIKHSDAVVDKYRLERHSGDAQFSGIGYDPYEKSTFWPKWLARNPYYQNWACRIRTGHIGQSLGEMTVRHYVLDKIPPPSAGKVKIVAKDILKLADNDRVQWPKPTNGELKTAISDTDDSFDLINSLEDEYPTDGGILRIGDEVMTYTSASWTDGTTTISGASRGQHNTEADGHDAEESAQLCVLYDDDEPTWEVMQDILINGAGISSGFINVDNEWYNEWNTYQPQYLVNNTLLTEPEGVAELLGELAQQTGCYIWWDERNQKIGYRALREPDEVPPKWTEDKTIIADSLSVKVRTEQRITQVWIYYQLRSPVHDIDEAESYGKRRINADLERETLYGSGQRLVIYSRWLRADAPVSVLASRLLSRYQDPPREITARVRHKDSSVWTADVVDAQISQFVSSVGDIEEQRLQVISAEEVRPGAVYEYVMQTSGLVAAARVARWMADGTSTYAESTEEERESGFWWAQDNGLMPDETEGYNWQ